MGLKDKAEAATDQVAGKAKEAVGDVTGDERLAAEGRTDQAKGQVKEAVENVKDAMHDAGDKIKDAFKK